MKKIVFLLFIFVASINVKATHLMGGEITWECIKIGPDAGKYIFNVKVYNFLSFSEEEKRFRVSQDPTLNDLEQAIDSGIGFLATGILGFGGGSPMDVAKLTALVLGLGEKIESIWGVNKVKGPRLPLILVPTTAGTGSEVTPVSIITVENREKRGVSSAVIIPDLAILDPSLTMDLPPAITATTGIDAMVHAIEAFTSKNQNNNLLSQNLAVEALALLGNSIVTAVKSLKSDRVSRSNMLYGSMLAGISFANSPVAGVHALAYPLGGKYKVSHGLSNALLLPHLIRFNMHVPATKEAYGKLAGIIFPVLENIDDLDQRVKSFAEEFITLSKHLIKKVINTILVRIGICRISYSKQSTVESIWIFKI